MTERLLVIASLTLMGLSTAVGFFAGPRALVWMYLLSSSAAASMAGAYFVAKKRRLSG